MFKFSVCSVDYFFLWVKNSTFVTSFSEFYATPLEPISNVWNGKSRSANGESEMLDSFIG